MYRQIIVDNIIYSLQKSGGVSVVWSELIKRFLKDQTIIVKYIEYPQSDNIFRNQLEIPQEKLFLSPYYSIASRYIDVKCQDIKTPFIFHSSYYRISSNPKAINITTVHDFTYEYYAKGIAKLVHCWQKHRAIRKSDYIICISENTKKDLLRFLPDIDPNKITVIHNGVSDDYFPLYSIDENILPFKKYDYLLFVGARDGYKNFEFLVSSLSGTQYNLVIVGAPLNNKETALLNTSIKDKWSYAGRLTNQELNNYYNGAYAFVYPSSYEGFGIPVLEAQRAGCPVIAYNSSSIPEIIGDTTLLLNNLTKDEFISKLNILENAVIRKSIIEDGIRNSNKYTWDSTYAKVIKLYDEIQRKILDV